MMSWNLSRMTQFLQEIALRISHVCEHAEPVIAKANRQIRNLGDSGLLNRSILLGPVLHSVDYPIGSGREGSSQAIMAALDVPRGMGVVHWDVDDYLAVEHDPEQLHADAKIYFQKYEDCEPAIQSLLLPHVTPLMSRLIERDLMKT
ncbi:MAG: hypothetical protein AABP62_12935 [Planctomycetota bacterium]